MLTAGPVTVKHIEDNGCESVINAISVSFVPARACHVADQSPRDEVIAYGVPLRPGSADEGGYSRYGDGTVYVMNEAGATVAKYELNRGLGQQSLKAA